jgi:hypothetical protein
VSKRNEIGAHIAPRSIASRAGCRLHTRNWRDSYFDNLQRYLECAAYGAAKPGPLAGAPLELVIDMDSRERKRQVAGQAVQNVQQHDRIDAAAQPYDDTITGTHMLFDDRLNARRQTVTSRRLP